MSRKKGQTYTAEQKTKIVLEMLKEEMTTSQLASKYGVTSQSLGEWKQLMWLHLFILRIFSNSEIKYQYE